MAVSALFFAKRFRIIKIGHSGKQRKFHAGQVATGSLSSKVNKSDLSAQAALKRKPSPVETLNDLIIDSIQDIKGKNIVKLDLQKLDDAPTDFFIICEGDSNTQVKAISNNIYKRLKEELGFPPTHVEGVQNSRWICMDYFNTVVHVFYRETREFYDIENLWSDAKSTEYENL
jgi:ribosome-associated protein